MDANALLLELYGRLQPLVDAACDGLDQRTLITQPPGGGNTIGWLLWHLTRVQDHHVGELVGWPQLWVSGAWGDRFELISDPENTGFGHEPLEMAAVRPAGPDAIAGYYEAVWARTEQFLRSLGLERLDEVVDDNWDPPVTLGVRLISVADDSLQHVGQAAYLRGLLVRADQ